MVNCFVCNKASHYAVVCKQRTTNNYKGSISKNKANVTEVEKIIVAVVSKAHMTTEVKEWVTASTRCICGNKEDLSSCIPIKENTEQVIVGNNRYVLVVGKGKALLKLTSGKTLSLFDVLNVSHFRHNLVLVHLLSKAGLKVLFNGDTITLTKHDVFVGKGYEDQGLFVINVANKVNENSSSCAYLVDSINIWHGRLGHINLEHINKMKETGIINSLSETNMDKCEVCVETKITKKNLVNLL
jgi:hypothetical protein